MTEYVHLKQKYCRRANCHGSSPVILGSRTLTQQALYFLKNTYIYICTLLLPHYVK